MRDARECGSYAEFARGQMVETRIKPYDEQEAEKARARGAAARLPAQPGVRAADCGGGDLRVVALAHQSEVDLSAGVVAVVRQGPAHRAGTTRCPAGNRDEPSWRRAYSVNEQSRSLKSLPLVVILLGPTGSGKTALSLALAERFSGEIVSCDSVAVYRGMELGTAKPTLEERARVPHHLIDVASRMSRSRRASTAGWRVRRSKRLQRASTLPIVTGGTGLYLRALTEGLFAGPARQEELRARLRRSAERHGSGVAASGAAAAGSGDGGADSCERHGEADSRD